MANCGSYRIRSLFKANATKRAVSLAILLTFGFTQVSCTAWRTMPFRSYEPPKLPEELAQYYDYPRTIEKGVVLKEEDRKRYVLKQVEFPLSLPDELWQKPRTAWEQEVVEIRKTNEKEARDLSLHYTNRIDLYLPKQKGPRPLILISPILGGNMVVDRFAKYFASRGYVAAIVHRKKSFYDESQGPDQTERYLRTSIIRLRQALDWLETQPEVDPKRIGSFGVSYGAILHSVLAALEPRIRYHILAMPAAPLPDVIMECPDSGVTKLLKKMRGLGWSDEKIHAWLQTTIKTEPLTFAPYVPKDRMLVFATLFDRIVGTSRIFKLWNAMGKPKLMIVPFGHYGALLIYPYLRMVSLSHFRAHL